MPYTTPRNAIRNALAQKSPLTGEQLAKYGAKVTSRASSTIERTIRDMVREHQLVKENGKYRLPESAPVSTALPPPSGGDAVRQAAPVADGDVEEDLSEDGIYNAVVIAIRKGDYAMLSDRKLRYLAKRGFLMMNRKGREWLEGEED